ncbi:hypothetical protein J7I98_15355 [Streptomyces sp. ISL-98]|uniref:hypothetical protein n=1 Tax=Streptomyces sp. ISL-98 TaxID=2819192 RepID=UPI001BE6611E|nr:hypothetical protein [Streptomyces sp. ISL-98]MBT2507244.1 hypothetical protein [Streptomyces sp. ISL-98]
MKTLASRTLVPAVTAAAALLALTTGCSSSDANSPKDDNPATEKAADQPAKEPRGAVLTETQLKAALVGKADAKAYEPEDNTAPAVRPKADKPECTALADMTASGTGRTPEAEAWASRTYGSSTAPGLAVKTGLLSYEGEGAQQTLDGVRKAMTDCAGGFSTTGNNGGATVKYVSVKPEQNAKSGDDSLSFVMTGEVQGAQVPMRFTLVREDNTVASFFTIHLAEPAKAKLPQDLFTSQVTKLAEHAGRAAS